MAAFTYGTAYPAAPAVVFPVLTNPDFLEDYAREVGATDWRVRVDLESDLTVTDVLLATPTSRIPALFRRFVGPTVDISELREWREGTSDGFAGDWTVHAVLGGRDSYVRGQMQLTEAENGSRLEASAQIDVHLGLLSKSAAGRIAELVTAALNTQAVVVKRWLADAPE